MKLHEAILEALASHDGALSFDDVARHIAARGTYLRPRDGLPPPPGQILRRVLAPTYATLFRIEGGRVSASGVTRRLPLPPVPPAPSVSALSFVPVAGYQATVPACRGLYAIRLLEVTALPPFYADVLRARGRRLLYVGQASRSLEERLGAELRAVGHGTFFRSLGAILGFTPPAGSLLTARNKYNYRFARPDRDAIVAWLERHAEVAWLPYDGDLDGPEEHLIAIHEPLLNLDGCEGLPEVRAARERCRAIARSEAPIA